MSIMVNIPGCKELESWLGYLPNFHDAEVLSIDLKRRSDFSAIIVHIWRTNEQLDEDGYFMRDRHTIVKILFSSVISMKLSGWNHQNVLARLDIEECDDGFLILLDGAFGIDGEIIAKNVRVEFEPQNSRNPGGAT